MLAKDPHAAAGNRRGSCSASCTASTWNTVPGTRPTSCRPGNRSAWSRWPTPRIRATRRLEEAMKTPAAAAAGVAADGGWPRLLAAFLLGGVTPGATLRPAPLLPPPHVASPHPASRRPSCGNGIYASQIGTEEAWQSVIEYFPEKEYLRIPGETAIGSNLPSRTGLRPGHGRLRRIGRCGRRGRRIPGVWAGREMRRPDASGQVSGVGRRVGATLADSRRSCATRRCGRCSTT